MPSYAVVGASRGVGLEYVRQLANKPDSSVFAIVRNAQGATYLKPVVAELKNVHVFEADVTDYASLETAAKQIGHITGGSLDYLIHSAARTNMEVLGKRFDSFATMDELDADFMDAFKINALGLVHTIHAFLPLLREGNAKRIITLNTANVDCQFIRRVGGEEVPAYAITKAAALVATTKWAMKLAPEGFVVVTISPGVADISETSAPAIREAYTQAGEFYAQAGLPSMRMQTVEQSVAAQLKVIYGLTEADNGKFLEYTGKELPL